MQLPYPLLPFLIGTLFLAGCFGDATPEAETAAAPVASAIDSLPPPPAPPALATGETVRAWVDGLFIRARPERGGTIVAQVTADSPLKYTGKRSDSTETIVLRGMAFQEPWLQVRTDDGDEGWVFGGAVTREGEPRGAGYRGEEQFSFPAFGDFDLREWDKQPPFETSTKESKSVIRIYQQGDRRLAVKRTQRDDGTYGRLYTLTTMDGRLLRTRELQYVERPKRALIETVTDYSLQPQETQRRYQLLDRPAADLNARPEIAYGEWSPPVPSH